MNKFVSRSIPKSFKNKILKGKSSLPLLERHSHDIKGAFLERWSAPQKVPMPSERAAKSCFKAINSNFQLVTWQPGSQPNLHRIFPSRRATFSSYFLAPRPCVAIFIATKVFSFRVERNWRDLLQQQQRIIFPAPVGWLEFCIRRFSSAKVDGDVCFHLCGSHNLWRNGNQALTWHF